MLRSVMLLAISQVIAISAYCLPWDTDSIHSLLSGRELNAIEGLWQFPDGGATILICRKTATTYDLIVIDSPDLEVAPGTIIGTAIETPDKNVYDASFDKRKLGNKRIKKAQAVLKITDDGHLRFDTYSQGIKLNLKRWLPYMFRVVENNDKRPSGLDGARRIYPQITPYYIPRL